MLSHLSLLYVSLYLSLFPVLPPCILFYTEYLMIQLDEHVLKCIYRDGCLVRGESIVLSARLSSKHILVDVWVGVGGLSLRWDPEIYFRKSHVSNTLCEILQMDMMNGGIPLLKCLSAAPPVVLSGVHTQILSVCAHLRDIRIQISICRFCQRFIESRLWAVLQASISLSIYKIE